ncbi:hypothetical protein Cgig2_011565 [Carnegiea gigantea]|uniref:Uncharacterized protein n=1 Tax=Carnegiea gigantea TaxID=171969 RepID=A0A9Q1JGY3_9CARY|nr:hypothetical protein Cgig2_011565 [Carnegiea gigantea]
MAKKCYMVVLNSNKTLDIFKKEVERIRPKRTRRVVECNHVDFIPTLEPNEETKEIFLPDGETKMAIRSSKVHKAKDPLMMKYLEKIERVLRTEYQEADELSKLTSSILKSFSRSVQVVSNPIVCPHKIEWAQWRPHFKLAFRTRTIIPVEIRSVSFRVQHYDLEQNEIVMHDTLYLLSEVQEMPYSEWPCTNEECVKVIIIG